MYRRDQREKLGIPDDMPLFVDTYAPGDGVMRYRFFTTPTDYFAGNGIYTALGRSEAVLFVTGFCMGFNTCCLTTTERE